MSCGCGGGGKFINGLKNAVKPVTNLVEAAKTQPDKIKWFKDGVSGIIKCIGEKQSYTDQEIIQNRDVCRQCEFSTKTDGKLTMNSQCMAKDENGQICGCFLLCKTSSGPNCPLKKWTHLTINGS